MALRHEEGASGDVLADTQSAPRGWMMNDVLLTVADVMTPTTVSATVHDTVVTAAEIIRRYSLGGLPVVEDGRVVGLVTPLQILREPVYRTVADVMTPEILPATPDLSLLQAHALITRQRIEVLPVVEGTRIVGQISLVAILRAHGQQTDPLTGLPWATGLRAWASTALAHGHEIAILFIDLDNFGEVNKALGHVIGDDILRSIAYLLSSLVDTSTDLLCRYGGDEFAIATTRQQDKAAALAQQVLETVSLPIEMNEASRRITVSVGFAGGRRVENRTPVHIAATVEDLLTLSSRASTAIKKTKQATERISRDGQPATEVDARAIEPAGMSIGPPPVETRLRLEEVLVDDDPNGCTVTVTMRLGTHQGIGRVAGPIRGRGASYLVAEATLAAIRQAVGERHTYVLEELTEVPTETEKLVVVELADGASSGPRRFVGGARGADLPHAVSEAILDALHGPLARTLAESLTNGTSL